MKRNYKLVKQNKTPLSIGSIVGGALLLANLNGAAQLASSLNFDGIDDKIDVPHSSIFNFSNQLSIEVWINTNVSGAQFITTKNEDSWYLAINGDNSHSGKASVFLNGITPGGWLNGSTNVSDGNWHHVAVTYDGSKLKLYVDGMLDGQSVQTGAVATGTSNVKIGMRPFFPTLNYFAGTMDELRLWNVARSQCDINAYMKCEIPATASGLVANFHFNQGSPSGNNSSVITLTNSAGTGNGALSNFALSGSTSNWLALAGVTSGSVTPLSIPSFSAGCSSTLVCAGESVTLTAAPANSYTWSNGGNTSTSVITPSISNNYNVTAFNGICEVMAMVQVSVTACTAVKENTLLQTRIFPLPSSESITIQFNQAVDAMVALYSTDGRKITSQRVEGTEFSMDVSALKAGLYLIQVEDGNQRLFYRVIKQ